MPLFVGVLDQIESLGEEFDHPMATCTLGRFWPNEDYTYAHLMERAERNGNAYRLPEGQDTSALIPGEYEAFNAIGVEDYEVVDIQHEGEFGHTHFFDMNQPSLPGELSNRFDVVYNTGTLEHIFHVPNAIANITKMLKIGGYVIHHIPVNNNVGHGFYQMSPCFFFDYYAANNFEIKKSKLTYRQTETLPQRPPKFDMEFYDPYDEDCNFVKNYWHLARFSHFFVARKTQDSTTDQIPIQGQGDDSGLGYVSSAHNIDVNLMHRKYLQAEVENESLRERNSDLLNDKITLIQKFEEHMTRQQNSYTQLLRKNMGLSDADDG